MISMPPDPYKALGVSKDAQIAEIRTAYRKLVLKCHPDKVQDPELKAQKADEFQKVQQAYELLNSEKERQRYDDQVRLAELREAMRAKANSSAPRTTTTYSKYANVDIRTPEPRSTTFKSASPPTGKSYQSSYGRSWEEGGSPRSYEEVRTPPRRESYSETKTSKRDSERERERQKEKDQRRKEKKAEEARRAEKDARRAEKKAREKAEEKERRRNTEEKKRQPYIETPDDEQPSSRSEKKRSSKKHDEKRERSTHRDDASASSIPPPPVPQMPQMPQERSYTEKEEYAASYIEAAKAKKLGNYRSVNVAPPSVPTPPPVAGQSGPFQPPAPSDDAEIHRLGKGRRGSTGEKYKKSPREVLLDPEVVNVSPSARHAQRSATTATLGSSPPRLGRQNTAPAADSFTRPIPMLNRASTYTGGYEDTRGRGRSRLQPQIEESESEEDYDRRHSRKHRSKKHRSPDPPRSAEYVSKYKVSSDGRATLQTAYSRSLEPDVEYQYSYPSAPTVHVVETHHGSSSRDAAFSRSAGSSYPKFPKVHTSKNYDFEDVSYSPYPATSYQDEYAYA